MPTINIIIKSFRLFLYKMLRILKIGYTLLKISIDLKLLKL